MKDSELEQLERLLLAYLDSYEFEEHALEAYGGDYLDVGDLIGYVLADIKRRREA